MARPDSQRYIWNLYLIKNVMEDIVLFMDLKLFIYNNSFTIFCSFLEALRD